VDRNEIVLNHEGARYIVPQQEEAHEDFGYAGLLSTFVVFVIFVAFVIKNTWPIFYE
jgi:hypothetical protein